MKKKVLCILSIIFLLIMGTGNVYGLTFIDHFFEGIADSAGNFFKDALDVVKLLYGRVPEKDFALLTDIMNQTDDSLLDTLFSWNDNSDADEIDRYLFIGDSRMERLASESDSDKDVFITDPEAGYSWLVNEGINEANFYITENTALILWIGANDLYNVDKYISILNEAVSDWREKGADVYVCSIGPVSSENALLEEETTLFNKKLINHVEDIGFIDLYKAIKKEGYSLADGIHYDDKTYEYIYTYIKDMAGSSIELMTDDGNRVWWSSYAKRDVYNRFTMTNWNLFEGMRINLFLEPVVKARLSEELKVYEADLEAAAKQYGFLPYKELFKAIAEYRYLPGSVDIFQIQETSLNPYLEEPVALHTSIDKAAELFRDCIHAADYPSPLEIQGLKAVLQAFEFEEEYFYEYCDGTYSIEKSQQFASMMCGGDVRLDAREADLYGLYTYKDQKFPDKILKYYSVISIGNANMSQTEQQLLSEAMAGWTGDLDERRKNLIQKGLSLYGSVKYSMDMRLEPRASSPNYLDCSSFVGWSYYYSGLKNVQCWWTTGTFLEKFEKINKSDLLPGDVGLINTVGEGGSNHIGIYLGNNVNGTPVWMHCSSSAGGIVINTYSGFNLFYRYPEL